MAARAVPFLGPNLETYGQPADGSYPKIVFDDATGAAGRSLAPVSCIPNLNDETRSMIRDGRLWLKEERAEASAIPCQLEESTKSNARLWFQMPSGPAGLRTFALAPHGEKGPVRVAAQCNPASGQFEITDSGKLVMVYNYRTIEPGDLLKSISPDNLKYARARSNYIHPLYGLDGEELTKDWPKDHPHHRGIYWAWPEVDWRGQRGDLHALQHVFARPTSQCRAQSGPVFAQIDAENLWKWEDRDPIVRERAVIRAYPATEQGRVIDLEFEFTALGEDVSVARRGTDAYGGLNIRCAEVRDQEIAFHTDPPEANPRMAWAALSGTFSTGKRASELVVMQSASNPYYPGDWVKFPELNWFQPTFPASGARCVIAKGKPLKLRFRLWMRPGPKTSEEKYRDQWRIFHAGS